MADPGFRMCVWRPEFENSFHLIKEPESKYSTELYVYDSAVIYIETLLDETYQVR